MGKGSVARCTYECTPYRLPLCFTKDQWREIIPWFLPEQQLSGHLVLYLSRTETQSRGHSHRFELLSPKMSGMFSGTVELVEIYRESLKKQTNSDSESRCSTAGRPTTINRSSGFLVV